MLDKLQKHFAEFETTGSSNCISSALKYVHLFWFQDNLWSKMRTRSTALSLEFRIHYHLNVTMASHHQRHKTSLREACPVTNLKGFVAI